MIVDRSGNLFTSDCPAYGQGVNTMGSMEAAIAAEFRKRWPGMFEEYRRLCRDRLLQPGGIHVYRAADRTTVNLATQRSFRRGAARLEFVCAAAREASRVHVDGLAWSCSGIFRQCPGSTSS